jgi:hypothetical protein
MVHLAKSKTISNVIDMELNLPIETEFFPHPSAIEWHRSNVFEY